MLMPIHEKYKMLGGEGTEQMCPESMTYSHESRQGGYLEKESTWQLCHGTELV